MSYQRKNDWFCWEKPTESTRETAHDSRHLSQTYSTPRVEVRDGVSGHDQKAVHMTPTLEQQVEEEPELTETTSICNDTRTPHNKCVKTRGDRPREIQFTVDRKGTQVSKQLHKCKLEGRSREDNCPLESGHNPPLDESKINLSRRQVKFAGTYEVPD